MGFRDSFWIVFHGRITPGAVHLTSLPNMTMIRALEVDEHFLLHADTQTGGTVKLKLKRGKNTNPKSMPLRLRPRKVT